MLLVRMHLALHLAQVLSRYEKGSDILKSSEASPYVVSPYISSIPGVFVAGTNMLFQEGKIRLGFLTVSGQRVNSVYLNMSVKSFQEGKRTNQMLHKWRRVMTTS